MKASPFLIFQRDAKAAITLWQRAFPALGVLEMQAHEERPQTGQIAAAQIRLGGLQWPLSNSPAAVAFSFTPPTSIFVDCEDKAQLPRLADTFGKDGETYMPIDNHGFSRLFTWIAGRFDVGWQLNLP